MREKQSYAGFRKFGDLVLFPLADGRGLDVISNVILS